MAWLAAGELRSGPRVLQGITAALIPFKPIFEAAVSRIQAAWGGDRSAMADLDVPMATWIGGLGLPPETTDFLMAYTAAMGGGDPARLSALGIIADAALLGYRFDDVFASVGESFEDGTASLVDAIASDVGGEFRLGAVVTRVHRDEQGVTVDLLNGGRVHARAGVLTLPVNVWSDIVFEPPLSAEKRRIAELRHPGASTKVLAVARGVPAGFVSAGWPATLQAVVGGREMAAGRLVVGFSGVGGIDATDAAAVEKALRAYLPDCEVLTSDGHDWIADRFSKGTWFAAPPGWESMTPAPRSRRRRLAFRRWRHRAGGGRVDRGRDRQRRRCCATGAGLRCDGNPEGRWDDCGRGGRDVPHAETVGSFPPAAH